MQHGCWAGSGSNEIKCRAQHDERTTIKRAMVLAGWMAGVVHICRTGGQAPGMEKALACRYELSYRGTEWLRMRKHRGQAGVVQWRRGCGTGVGGGTGEGVRARRMVGVASECMSQELLGHTAARGRPACERTVCASAAGQGVPCPPAKSGGSGLGGAGTHRYALLPQALLDAAELLLPV